MNELPPREPYMLTIHPSGTYQYQRLIMVPTAEILHEGGIEGPLEIVPFFRKLGLSPCIAFCDGDGKGKGLEPNRAAQALWRLAVGRYITEDHLVGPIVIVVGKEAFLDRL